MQNHSQPSTLAKWLGYLGVLPFLLTSINLHISWPLFNGFALQVFIIYSAVILSFLGGIRWGLALLQPPPNNTAMLLSVLPSIAALSCLLLAQPFWQIVSLAIAFTAMVILDWLYRPSGMPNWMLSLRIQLTILVVSCHGIALVAVRRWT